MADHSETHRVENPDMATPPAHKSTTKWVVIGAGALVLGLLVGWGLLQLLERPYIYHGTVIQSQSPAANFTLTGAGDEQVSLSDFRDKVVLLYFGYTYCPDVCPATMVELKKAMQILGEDADKAQVILISVDPDRDSPEKLAEYVTHFNPNFIGLTGTEDEIAGAATPFGIFYEKHPGSIESGYLIDHTASVVAIDPDGYLRLVYPFDTPGEAIAADIQEMAK